MDIIAAHQQGLIEQLDAEVEALAGRPGDHVQRAIVLHHLYEHSKGGHLWALAEARRTLRIAHGLARLEKRLARWHWTIRNPNGARLALEGFTQALGETGTTRTIAAYRAYRLSATKALRSEAEASLPSSLLQGLDGCHTARRADVVMTVEAVSAMAEESRRFAEAATDHEKLQTAWGTIQASGLGRSARRLLGDKALAHCEAGDERKGCARVERQLRADLLLPASFRANPAQHFYALQNALAERRRKQWREAADRESGAVALAA